jgi:hypothetical protein
MMGGVLNAWVFLVALFVFIALVGAGPVLLGLWAVVDRGVAPVIGVLATFLLVWAPLFAILATMYVVAPLAAACGVPLS